MIRFPVTEHISNSRYALKSRNISLVIIVGRNYRNRQESARWGDGEETELGPRVEFDQTDSRVGGFAGRSGMAAGF
jgi:hypothetical protein